VQVREVFSSHGFLHQLGDASAGGHSRHFLPGKLDESFWETFAMRRRCQSWKTFTRHTRRKKRHRGMIAGERPRAACRDHAHTRGSGGPFPGPGVSYAWMGRTPELSCPARSRRCGRQGYSCRQRSQDPDNRAAVKALYLRDGRVTVKGVGDDEKKAPVRLPNVLDYSEPLSTLKAHRVRP